MKRIVSNIQNLGFTIMNDMEEGTKQKASGIELNQTLVNDMSEGVSVRLLNGKTKSAAVKLDRGCLGDLKAALDEILSIEGS